MTLTANIVFGNYVIPGVPASGAKEPIKAEIRELLTGYETAITAFTSNGGLIYATRALLYADLDHDAHASAWVISDSTLGYSGVYQKLGASGAGSWSRIADLPYSFIQCTDAGAGTANAIIATSSIPQPTTSGAALFLCNVFEANTGAVTLALNGATAKPIITNTGNPLTNGYLTAGMRVVFVDSGANWILISDVASAAIQAACEAAAVSAAADAALALTYKTAAELAATNALAAANATGPVNIYATKALADAALAGLAANAIVEVSVDESRNDLRTRYRKTGGVYVFEVYLTVPSGVTLEQFGDVSAGADNNALLTAALATGKPVLCLGPLYKFDQFVSTVAGQIIFGANTEVRNVQASGTKYHAIRFQGALTGSAISVTVCDFGSTGQTDQITLSDASSFAVGDKCYLSEAARVVAETYSGGAYGLPASSQDFAYWEFCTIKTKVGNVVTFEEFLRWPYLVANTMTLQKVAHLENCHVQGGLHTGGNNGGGGVALEFCRASSVKDIRCVGNSDADRSGGSPVKLSNCWECKTDNISAKWTLFVSAGFRNQSCIFGSYQGKRTSSGGMVHNGDILCTFETINLDSPGDTNGDAFGATNGFRRNTIGTLNVSAGHCYLLWIHESCDGNTFNSIVSVQGLTGGIYDFGSKNRFLSASIDGHPSFGLSLWGTDTYANVDISVLGAGVTLNGTNSGRHVVGKSVSTGVSGQSYDLIINAGGTSDRVDVLGGTRGMVYGTGVVNHSNDIIVRGANPYTLRVPYLGRGFGAWPLLVTGVSTTPANLKVPLVGGTDGLTDLVATASTTGIMYRILAHANFPHLDTASEYICFARSSIWYIKPIIEGANASSPRVTASGANLQLSLNSGSAVTCFVEISKS